MENSYKYLITFLGLGQAPKQIGNKRLVYTPTIYEFQGVKSSETQFICKALNEIFKPENTIVLHTEKAKENVWDILTEEINNQFSIQGRVIPDGKNVNEIWTQFEIIEKLIFNALKEGNLIIDITHGFRSQPFIMAGAIAFARSQLELDREIKVVYGAFNFKEGDTTPVWDLTAFIELLDWTRGVDRFLATGKSKLLVDLVTQKQKELDTQEKNIFKKFRNAIETFGDDFSTLRTGNMLLKDNNNKKSAINLLRWINEAKPILEKRIPPLDKVIQKIISIVEPLDAENLCDQKGQNALAHLANVYFNMGRYFEAAVTIREALTNRFVEKEEEARPGQVECNDNTRKKADDRASEETGKKPYDPWGLKQLRNDLMHGGYRPSPSRPSKIIGNLEKAVKQFKELKDGLDREIKKEEKKENTYFLNLSNHPSSEWEEKQVNEALKLCKAGIIDMHFPDIDPEADLDDLEIQAKELIQNIPKDIGCAMVQGEHTMVLLLVKLLQERGIKCFAATTFRDVKNLENGTKVSRFTFKKFREYPIL